MAEEGAAGAVHLLCLAASSGVPLFCRSSRGGAPSRQQLPFSVIGSLNGVHMFGQNLDVTLRSARTEDTAVVWKTFHDSVTLIVLCSETGLEELRLERLLELVFGAMVLLVGLEELTKIRNVERLKKDLRATYGLIDSLLVDTELAGDLTQCVDCIVPADGPLLQEALAGFAKEMGSAFASLVAGGRVAAGTEGWWRLGAPEAVLLPWLVGTLPAQTARDYPVYLPHGSPSVPHRLLTLMLLPGLELCVLCGPQPPLSQVEPQAPPPTPGAETGPLHSGPRWRGRSFSQYPPAPPTLLLCAGHCHPLPPRGQSRGAGVPRGSPSGLLRGVWGSCGGATGPTGPWSWAPAGGSAGRAPPPPAAGESPEPNTCLTRPGYSEPTGAYTIPLSPNKVPRTTSAPASLLFICSH
ncbi:protein fuzzy homolog isoform X4 [Petaurus breviceps papuanus]|uniref:protein fuzzy homolog isoform X4 n=1 Tax=Petaurus breviceps papuanus TaxID=3040969 RepID=UPI0036D787DA